MVATNQQSPQQQKATTEEGKVDSSSIESKQKQEELKPFTTPPLVTETLQYRLDTGIISKVGGQRGSLTRCAQKYGIFLSKLKTEPADAEQIEEAKNVLIQDLQLYKLEMNKIWLNQQISNDELLLSKKQTMKSKENVIKEESNVKVAQINAQRARDCRNCFLEYEALAKLANTNFSQPRRILEKQIIEVKDDLKKLQIEIQSIDKTLRIRETQFNLLIQYMLDLKRTLQVDEEKNNPTTATTTSSHTKDGSAGGGKKKSWENPQEKRPAKRLKQRNDDDEEGAIEEENVSMQIDIDDQEGDALYGDLL